jgi:hypothetical protein
MMPAITGLKPGVNEMALIIYTRLNKTKQRGQKFVRAVCFFRF